MGAVSQTMGSSHRLALLLPCRVFGAVGIEQTMNPLKREQRLEGWPKKKKNSASDMLAVTDA